MHVDGTTEAKIAAATLGAEFAKYLDGAAGCSAAARSRPMGNHQTLWGRAGRLPRAGVILGGQAFRAQCGHNACLVDAATNARRASLGGVLICPLIPQAFGTVFDAVRSRVRLRECEPPVCDSCLKRRFAFFASTARRC